jgi:hypothetical protein
VLEAPSIIETTLKLTDPRRFAARHGLTTLERYHDLEAEQGTLVNANRLNSTNASNGGS